MLDNLKATAMQLISNKKFLAIVLLSCLFIGVAIYVYMNHISPKLNPSFVPNKEFVQKDEKPKNADIYFFFTDWCPHSKKSKPIFEKVKKIYDGKPINGTIIHFHEVDGEKQEEEMTLFEKEHKVSIDGFPSIYLVKSESIVEYDANPTQESLSEFLNTTL
jgi:thiol-disulfide isomerase/thioredoxin